MRPIDSVAANLISIAERPELRNAICLVDRIAYPPFMAHIDQAALWPLVYAEFPEFQLVLVDRVSGSHLAHANAVPFAWDGRSTGLPSSGIELIELALRHKRGRRRPTALGGLQVVVNPEHQRIGLSTPMLQAVAAMARTAGLRAVFAPIRPTHKPRYPLTPLSNYVTWQRPDGVPLDPWQRVHARLGATQAGIAEQWLKVTAKPANWEAWTGLVFPVSGSYVVPGALVPIDVDLERNVASYVEPHLWMHYRLDAVTDVGRSRLGRAA